MECVNSHCSFITFQGCHLVYPIGHCPHYEMSKRVHDYCGHWSFAVMDGKGFGLDLFDLDDMDLSNVLRDLKDEKCDKTEEENTSRFAHVTDYEIKDKIKEATPQNTRRQNTWALKVGCLVLHWNTYVLIFYKKYENEIFF